MTELLTLETALYVCQHMRYIDAEEVLATMDHDSHEEFAQMCAFIGGVCYRDAAGVPVAIGGVREAWPGVGIAWMVGTDAVPKNKMGLTKLGRELMVTHAHLHRIQALSASFHTVSHEWLELVGFERSHTLRKYGKNGQDFIMFEIVR